MTEQRLPQTYKLIDCPSCGKAMSVDADSCPGCGGKNTWVHPKLLQVIEHLNSLERETAYEAQGHRMQLISTTQNFRQKVGSFLMLAAMVLLPVSFFIAPLLGLAILCICIGGGLTLFGLSVSTRHDLQIDLRLPGSIVGQYDRMFWADEIRIINRPDMPLGERRSSPDAPAVTQ